MSASDSSSGIPGGKTVSQIIQSVKSIGSSVSGLPDILWTLSDDAVQLLQDPRGFIISVVVMWFVSGMLDVITGMVNGVLSAFAVLAMIPGIIIDPLGVAGRAAANAIQAPIAALIDMIVGLATSGPVGALVAGLLAIVLVRLILAGGQAAASYVSPLLGAVMGVVNAIVPWDGDVL